MSNVQERAKIDEFTIGSLLLAAARDDEKLLRQAVRKLVWSMLIIDNNGDYPADFSEKMVQEKTDELFEFWYKRENE